MQVQIIIIITFPVGHTYVESDVRTYVWSYSKYNMVNNAFVRREYNSKICYKWLIRTLLYIRRLVCVFGLHSFAVFY